MSDLEMHPERYGLKIMHERPAVKAFFAHAIDVYTDDPELRRVLRAWCYAHIPPSASRKADVNGLFEQLDYSLARFKREHPERFPPDAL